jgi:hypothetical protein
VIDWRRLAGVGVLCSALTLGVHGAEARPGDGWAAHADTLARVCVAEADGSQADCAAILWTLEHRRQVTGAPVASVIVYSATLKLPNERAERIHTLSLEELHPLRARQIREARMLVDAWLEGRVKDPCPSATHWRGTSDAHPSWLVEVDCGGTRNTFGRTKGAP